jgi:hypothetical protein
MLGEIGGKHREIWENVLKVGNTYEADVAGRQERQTHLGITEAEI